MQIVKNIVLLSFVFFSSLSSLNLALHCDYPQIGKGN